MLKLLVFIKPVADNTKLKTDQLTQLTDIPRDGVTMMINPYDEYALETALRLKEAANGDAQITAISLAGAHAKELLKKAVSHGADDAFLLSDTALLNGDSVANSLALAQAIGQLVPDYPNNPVILLFGTISLDDAAGQTGPMVAERLNIPSVTSVKHAELQDAQTLKVTRETEQGLETLAVKLPAALCTMKCDYELRTANIKGVMKANKTEIPVKTAADLGLEATRVGQSGSVRQYLSIAPRPGKTGGIQIDGSSDPKAAAQKLFEHLKQAQVI